MKSRKNYVVAVVFGYAERMLDLRKPTGWFFLSLGVLLIAQSALAPEARAPLTTVNVNLYTGAAMGLFGGVMIWLAQKS